MKRFPWDILIALLIGLGIGLAYSWVISPLRLVDSIPSALRADFKDQYRTLIAASYAATGNLPRAQARLQQLGDANLIESLNAQAQREISSSEFTQADQLAALAFAIENGTNGSVQIEPTIVTAETIETQVDNSTASPFPSPADMPLNLTETQELFETPQIETAVIVLTPTPRSTHTPIPTVGAPFRLISQDLVCDVSLPPGLLQVFVFNSNRKQMPGIKIVVTWDSGSEEFFTGLKPELGNGYADFLMEPGESYSVQLATGSDIPTNIATPSCQAPNGEGFIGGYKITFQQP